MSGNSQMKDALLVPVSSFIVISMITDLSPSNRAATFPALVVHVFFFNFGSLAVCFSFGETSQPVTVLPLTLPAIDKHSCYIPSTPTPLIIHPFYLFPGPAVHASGERVSPSADTTNNICSSFLRHPSRSLELHKYKLSVNFKIELFSR